MNKQIDEYKDMNLLNRLVCERAVGHPLCTQLKEKGEPNSVDRFFGVAAIAAGTITGFLEGWDINLPSYLGLSLKITPTVLQSATEWYVGANTAAALERYTDPTWPWALRGAALGAGKTTLGYCIGYTAANIIKKHLQ